MFRFFLFFLITLFSLVAYPQDTINQMDSQGRKQGYWQKRDSLGRLAYDGYFKDGHASGTFHYYYQSGNIKTVSTLSQNGKRAVVVSFFQNGQKMASGIYYDEKKDSIWHFFSEKDGSLVSEESYEAGVKNGCSKLFFPDGVLADSTTWKNGKMEGLSEQYYSDGKIKVRSSYRNGEKQDAFNTYFMSGQTMISGHYLNDHPDGHWIYYNEKGEIVRTEDY